MAAFAQAPRPLSQSLVARRTIASLAAHPLSSPPSSCLFPDASTSWSSRRTGALQARHSRRAAVVRCATAAQPALQSAPALPHVNWSARAIKTFSMGELEARKLKYPTTGSEALLMGMLTEGTSTASRFLRSKGIRLMDLREETVRLLGKADMYFFSPEHPPLTPQAQAALQWAIQEHQNLGGEGEVSVELILLGIWEQKEEGAGHRLLSNLGFTQADADELRKLL